MARKVHKIYQSIISQFLATNVVIGKDQYTGELDILRVVFKGGTRHGNLIINGKYGTTDQRVQDALESSPSFNKKWKLIRETVTGEDDPVEEVKPAGEPEPEGEPVIKDEESPGPGEAPEETPEGDEGNGLVCEATTVQEAKEFLKKNFPEEATHRGLLNGQLVRQFAIEHGVKLPNLK